MFREEIYLEKRNNVVPPNYTDIVMLVEEKSYDIPDILGQIEKQINMCEEIIRTGEPKTVTVETEEGLQSETITEITAIDYRAQAMFLLVGTITYAEEHDLIEAIPDSIYQEVSEEIKQDFKYRVGLSEENPEEPEAKEAPKSVDLEEPINPDEVVYKGW